MESFLKKILSGNPDEDCHRYLIRFGKGEYKRRFLLNLSKGKKIKLRTSFELANDLVNFVKENSSVKFSGGILTKEKLPGKESKKKGGLFIHEIQESSLEMFPVLISCISHIS